MYSCSCLVTGTSAVSPTHYKQWVNENLFLLIKSLICERHIYICCFRSFVKLNWNKMFICSKWFGTVTAAKSSPLFWQQNLTSHPHPEQLDSLNYKVLNPTSRSQLACHFHWMFTGPANGRAFYAVRRASPLVARARVWALIVIHVLARYTS